MLKLRLMTPLSLLLVLCRRLPLASVLALGLLSLFAAPVDAIVFGNVQFSDSVNNIPNQQFSTFDITDQGASVAGSRVLFGDDGLGTTGTTSGSAAATAIFAGRLLHTSMFASSTVSVTSPRIGGIPIYSGHTSATVNVFDTITVLGGSMGSLAQLHVIFDLSGTLMSNSGVTTSVAALVLALVSPRTTSARSEFSSINGSEETLPGMLDFLLEYEFGVPSQLEIAFTVEADGILFRSGAMSQRAEASNSLTLRSMTVMDEEGHVVPGASVFSASGFAYPVTEVPWPTPGVLIVMGWAVLWRFRAPRASCARHERRSPRWPH